MRKFRKWTPKEKRDEVVLMYLSGNNSVEELGEYYNVNPATASIVRKDDLRRMERQWSR